MYKIGNNIVKIGNKLPISVNNTILEFTVRGSSFPDRTGPTGMSFTTTGVASQNSMFIDYNDGTGIHEYPFVGTGTNFVFSSILHYYQNLADPTKVGTVSPNYMEERTIKIWFKFPSRITVISWQNFDLYGELPSNLQNYNWELVRLTNHYNIHQFPLKLGGLKTNRLILMNLSNTKLNYLPAWIENSVIPDVRLNNIFRFSGVDSTITGIDGLANIKGLTLLSISDNNMITNAEFPTMANCATLRTYNIAQPDLTTLPLKVSECTQLTTLLISRPLSGEISDNFNNWGAGIGQMTSLTELVCGWALKLPTDIPTGMVNCVALKYIDFNGSFLTQLRVDTFVNNMYDFVVANASTALGNTKFRQMTINIASGSVMINPRPTGNYTDEDSPLGKIWRMVNIYKHTWIVKSSASNADQFLTP